MLLASTSCSVGVEVGTRLASDAAAATESAGATSTQNRDEYSRSVAAQGEIGRFHTRWQQHDYRAIYGNAAPELRERVTLTDFQSMLESSAARLGAPGRTRELDRALDWRGDDLLITFRMDSKFEKADAVETFVWRVTSSNVVYLVSYSVEVGGVRLTG